MMARMKKRRKGMRTRKKEKGSCQTHAVKIHGSSLL
jgi:hypothetical protein